MEETKNQSILSENTNRLSKEKSPYLLQHKNNPVDWYPWGQEAFERAKKEDKLIFLSIGYSTCHWCHVMAQESFENPQIAKIMNENFVNIKVDREERPDIDSIYMMYVQQSQGSGGWPLSVWLTPSLAPLIGATYLPPHDKYGVKSFPSVLLEIAKGWKLNKEKWSSLGNETVELLKKHVDKTNKGPISPKSIETCLNQLEREFDDKFGGFSDAPKFPRPVVFQLLFRAYKKDTESVKSKRALEMALYTLTKMGMGGMYDQVGGGFHRYSVTADWHIPHFEKMLYDQAQLADAYLIAFQITKEPFYEKIARGILDYVIRDMTSKEGGFYSAEDADSPLEHGKPEHAEGAFYAWKQTEIASLLGDKASKIFSYHYGVEPSGNAPIGGDPHGEFKGKNILIQRHSISETAQQMGVTEQECEKILTECLQKLFEHRNKRPRPHLDDKIITAWNALMISAFSRGYSILGEKKYLDAARNAATFISSALYKPETHTLTRNYRNGPSSIEGFADDYSFMVQALLDLYEASFEEKWLEWAIQLQEKMNKLFWNEESGGYFSFKKGQPDLLIQMRDKSDDAEPSSNSVTALNLLRLSQLTGKESFREQAETTLKEFSEYLGSVPTILPYMCVALDFFFSTTKQIIIIGKRSSDDVQTLVRTVNNHFIPNRILLFGDQGEGQQYLATMLPVMKDLTEMDGKATAYVCENFTCKLPVNTPEQLNNLLK